MHLAINSPAPDPRVPFARPVDDTRHPV